MGAETLVDFRSERVLFSCHRLRILVIDKTLQDEIILPPLLPLESLPTT